MRPPNDGTLRNLVPIATAVFAFAVMLVAGPNSVSGLPSEPGEVLDVGENCNDSDDTNFFLSKPSPASQGKYFVGTPVQLSGIAQATNGWGNRIGAEPCQSEFVDVPDFAWELERPSFSSAALSDTDTLQPGLTLDVAGTYTVRLIACPGDCAIDFPGDPQPFVVEETTLETTLVAAVELAFPPHTVPIVRSADPYCHPELGSFDPEDADDEDHPADPIGRFDPCQTTDFSDDRLNWACSGSDSRLSFSGGGFVDPQWVTTTEWDGQEDYVLIEGQVASSRISRMDNYQNHESQDVNVQILADAPSLYLVSTKPESFSNPNRLGVEWERDHWPERFRPTPGDRISMFGYWIHDCGHEPFYTEIHPPIGAAVHRQRAVLLPEDLGLGSNVLVPGIVSDIWFNEDSGEITDDCSDTGLHQPNAASQPVGMGLYCIPTPDSGGPAPLPRSYTFNIFLPPSPEQILLDNGHPNPPDVELYYTWENDPAWGGSNGPEPEILPVTEGSVTYLRVTVDLTGRPDIEQYSRRIIAAWAYPSPDNWGLREYSVEIDELTIESDADWTNETLGWAGEWRLWANIANTDQEWTQIVGCSCISDGDHHRFGNRKWATRNSDLERNLGPHVLVFPEQPIWLHTSGFEDDDVTSDDAGTVSVQEIPRDPPNRRVVVQDSECTWSAGPSLWGIYPDDSVCGEYMLHAIIDPIGSVLPVLEPAGQVLYEQSIVSTDELGPCLAAGRDDCLDLISPADRLFWHPHGNHPTEPLSIFDTFAYRRGPSESNVLTKVSAEALADIVRSHSTERLDAALAEMREYFSEFRADYQGWDLLVLEAVLTPEQWEEYFADLPFVRPVHGDADCDQSLGSGDLFVILEGVAGLRRGVPCRLLADPDCSDLVDLLDLLRLARHQAGLTNAAPSGGDCPAIGSEFELEKVLGPSPTGTATPQPTSTVTPTVTPTETPTSVPSATPTPTPSDSGGASTTATTTTAPTLSPTVTPTSTPSPTPTPAPSPDNVPPTITNITHSPTTGDVNDQPGCSGEPYQLDVSANINDNSGAIPQKRVYWKYDYQVAYTSYAIPTFTHLGKYHHIIDPLEITVGSSAQLQYFFWAQDASGNATTSTTRTRVINDCLPID